MCCDCYPTAAQIIPDVGMRSLFSLALEVTLEIRS